MALQHALFASLAVLIAVGSRAAAQPLHAAGWSPDAKAVAAATPAGLIAALESLDPAFYADPHGNAHDLLQALMVRRFAATTEITRAIERLEAAGANPQLVAALMRVLAVVKASSTIAWLERRTRPADADLFYTTWAPLWQYGAETYLPWLQDRDAWLAFFARRYAIEPVPDRRIVLLDVVRSLGGPAAAQLFRAEAPSPRGPKEAVMIAAWSRAQGLPIDPVALRGAIDVLERNAVNRAFLLEQANDLRDPAFIQFLLGALPSDDADEALQAITFETSVRGPAEWHRWIDANGSAGRDVWRDRAVDAMRRRLAADEREAAAFFERAVYRWNDIALLPFVETELATRPRFRAHVAGWINLTYKPEHRDALARVAGLLTPHAESLPRWARDLLVDRGFLPRPPTSWDDYVRLVNAAI
jgi:hypothetical protein